MNTKKGTWKLLVFCSAWMYDLSCVNGWEVYANVQDKNPLYTDPHQKFGPRYVKVIKEIKPDFVIAVNVGCSERLFDAMEKPKGPKYVTWSTDSYRHAKRCATSDLHLSSIPDATLLGTDNFAPLFFEHRGSPIPLNMRLYEFGIHCRDYRHQNNYRLREIARLKRVLGDRLFASHEELSPAVYLNEIGRYAYGVNVGVYDDGLPNFRSFEYGALGVMPVSPRACNDENLMRELFGDKMFLYDEPAQLNSLRAYEPREIQDFYNEKHCLAARLKDIFPKYFGIEFGRDGRAR